MICTAILSVCKSGSIADLAEGIAITAIVFEIIWLLSGLFIVVGIKKVIVVLTLECYMAEHRFMNT